MIIEKKMIGVKKKILVNAQFSIIYDEKRIFDIYIYDVIVYEI